MNTKLFILAVNFFLLALSCEILHAQTIFETKGCVTRIPEKFENAQTYSGETYFSREMVAAHLTLPFGTTLRVKNTDNNKEVIVKVIHRGPFNSDAILSLSSKAWSQLELTKNNAIEVSVIGQEKINSGNENTIYYLLNTQQTKPTGYGVQIASVRNKGNIFSIADSLQKSTNEHVFVQVYNKESVYYRLIIGDMNNYQQAITLSDSLKRKFPDCFVVNFLNYE